MMSLQYEESQIHNNAILHSKYSIHIINNRNGNHIIHVTMVTMTTLSPAINIFRALSKIAKHSMAESNASNFLTLTLSSVFFYQPDEMKAYKFRIQTDTEHRSTRHT